MFRTRGLFLVVISLVLGVGAALLANNWVKARAAAVDASSDTVMVAALTIPYGTKVEPRHVKAVQLPAAAIPSNAIRTPAEVEGWVSTAEILEGELLMKGRFVEHGSGSTLAALVAPGKRAVSVRVNDVIGVGGFLLPGNFVDVLGTRLERGGSRTAITETIIQNVKVLAVDQTAASKENEPVVVRAVTLELDPKEAEHLAKWEEEGTLQLALRNPNDTMVAEEKPVAKPAPAPRPRPARQPVSEDRAVQVIKGTQVQEAKAKS